MSSHPSFFGKGGPIRVTGGGEGVMGTASPEEVGVDATVVLTLSVDLLVFFEKQVR